MRRCSSWKTLNANSKEYDDCAASRCLNWGNTASLLSEGNVVHMKMRDVMYLADLEVSTRNHIDVFVNPTITLPPRAQRLREPAEIHDRPNGTLSDERERRHFRSSRCRRVSTMWSSSPSSR